MAEKHQKMRPASKELAPDPATSYERAKPEKEAGMGRLDNNTNATPRKAPDRSAGAVKNQQPLRQVNAHDVVDEQAHGDADGAIISSQPAEDPDRDGD